MRPDINSHAFKNLNAYCACEAERSGHSSAEIAAASDIVEAVMLHKCGIVAVRRSGQSTELVIVTRTGVGVLDNGANRCTAGHSVNNSRENFKFVGFLSWG